MRGTMTKYEVKFTLNELLNIKKIEGKKIYSKNVGTFIPWTVITVIRLNQ